MAGQGIDVQSGFRINGPQFADVDFNWDSISDANVNIPVERRYEGKPIYIGQVTPAETGLYFLDGDLITWNKYIADSPLLYLGTFDPNVGAVPQVIDGSVNYDPGNLFVCNVAGFYNFTTGDQTPDGGGDNIANLDIGDFVIYNPTLTWEVIENTSPLPTVADKDLAPIVTAGNAASTGISFTAVATNGYLAVYVNGLLANLTGDLLGECYFSGDAGVSAKALGSALNTDVLYWNGIIAGYDLAVIDRIDLLYS